MRYRWTMKELEGVTDTLILITLIGDRLSTITNVYSPLSKRLHCIYKKLEIKLKKEGNIK